MSSLCYRIPVPPDELMLDLGRKRNDENKSRDWRIHIDLPLGSAFPIQLAIDLGRRLESQSLASVPHSALLVTGSSSPSMTFDNQDAWRCISFLR